MKNAVDSFIFGMIDEYNDSLLKEFVYYGTTYRVNTKKLYELYDKGLPPVIKLDMGIFLIVTKFTNVLAEYPDIAEVEQLKYVSAKQKKRRK